MNLTSEQIQAIRQGEPVRVILPEIGEECVVLAGGRLRDYRSCVGGAGPKAGLSGYR